MPGFTFPPVGPGGLGSPPSPVLCSAKTAILSFSRRCACRSRPDPLAASVRAWCPQRARHRVEAPRPRQGLWSPGPPGRECSPGDRWLSHVPESPLCMPRSSTPGVSWGLAFSHPGLLPSGHWKPSAFLSRLPCKISLCPRLYPVRGARTRPASSFPSAPHSHYWACTWSSLLTCWRGVHQVGLELSLAPTGEHQPIS